jgi:nucleoside-diphosphate kinase
LTGRFPGDTVILNRPLILGDLMQQTLIVFKPDALQRRLAGTILARFERKGLTLAAMKLMRVDEPLARRMYAEHDGKDFYEPLLRFIMAGPVIPAVLDGHDAVAVTRRLVGATFGPDAAAGTIRGDFGISRRYNLVHASDSPESARREIALFFTPDEIQPITPTDYDWLYADIDRKGPDA